MLKGKKPNTLNLRKFINKYQHNIYMLKEEFPNTLIFEIILITTLLLYMLKGKKPNTLNLRNYINNHSTTIYVKRRISKHFEKKTHNSVISI